MAEENQGAKTEPDTHQGQVLNTDGKKEDNQDGSKGKEEIDLSTDPRIQAEIDRRVTSAVQTTRDKVKQEVETAVENARAEVQREAEEKKLLEEGKTEELLELEKERRIKAEEKLAKVEHREKVDALLDKREVTDITLRKFLHKFNGDLAEVNETIDGLNEFLEQEVSKQVSEKLKTPLPPSDKSSDTDTSGMSTESQMKAAEAKATTSGKPEDWATFRKIANIVSDKIASGVK